MKKYQITDIISFLGRTEGICKGLAMQPDECSPRVRDILKEHADMARSICDEIVKESQP